MFTKKVTDDDNFMSLSSSAQALYLHLSMNADDDGFCNQVSVSMFKAHASVQDLQALLEKRYIYQFENGVIVIKHWRMANALRKDRYTPTAFQEELAKLDIKDNGSYTLKNDDSDAWLPDGCQLVATGKDSIGKDSIGNSNTGGDAPKPPKPKQEHSFAKHTNVQNLDYVITHNDLTVNPDLYSIIADWMEYKDQKKKGQNHYDTEKGITTLITKFTKNCNEYGLDAVRHAVEESIANNYQGIVWEKAQQFRSGKGNYTYKPQQNTTTNDLDPQIAAQLRALEEQQMASMPDIDSMSDEDIDRLIRGEL
jgi:hypothetical protein